MSDYPNQFKSFSDYLGQAAQGIYNKVDQWSFKVLIEGAASMVDHEINRMQSSKSSTSSSGPSTTGKSKVKVEVS